MAPHSSTLAWKIPWTEEPGGLQSMGSLRVGHDWVTSLSFFTFMHWRRKWQPTPCSCWRIPGMGKPGGLPSMGSHRVGHDWSDLAATAVFKWVEYLNINYLKVSFPKKLENTLLWEQSWGEIKKVIWMILKIRTMRLLSLTYSVWWAILHSFANGTSEENHCIWWNTCGGSDVDFLSFSFKPPFSPSLTYIYQIRSDQ